MSKHTNVQYVTDENGRKKAVQLSLKEWDKIQKDMLKLEILEDLKQAFKDMKQHATGKLRTPSTKQLLHSL